jgi:uncharacterized phiE125 gp8 family phage protein
MSVTIEGLNRYGRYGYALIKAVEVDEPPLAFPVADQLVKDYLRIDTDDTSQDDVIEALTAAAVVAVEEYANVSLITQTRRTTFGNGQLVRLPLAPVQTITAVEEQDTDGDWSATSAYTNMGNGEIRFAAPGVYRVTYTAGFGESQSSVPDTFKTAVLRHVKEHYEIREGVAFATNISRIDGLTWQDAAQPKKTYAL